jgi:hypothetical protein
MSMRSKLSERLSYLNADVRARVIDDVLSALHTPTPFMVEEGAASLKRDLDKPYQARAEWCFQHMIQSAQECG